MERSCNVVGDENLISLSCTLLKKGYRNERVNFQLLDVDRVKKKKK